MTARDPRIVDHKVIFHPAPNANESFDQRVDSHTLDDKERVLGNATDFFIHTAIILQMPPRKTPVQSYCIVTISPSQAHRPVNVHGILPGWKNSCVTVLRGIPTRRVGCTPLSGGPPYLIVYKELVHSSFWRAQGAITYGGLHTLSQKCHPGRGKACPVRESAPTHVSGSFGRVTCGI